MNKTEENLRRIQEYNRAHVGDTAFGVVQDDWDESKHPRAANGQFGSGGGSAAEEKNRALKAAIFKQATAAVHKNNPNRETRALEEHKARVKKAKSPSEAKAAESAKNLMDEYGSAVYPPVREAWNNYIKTGNVKHLKTVGEYFASESGDSSVLRHLNQK